VTFFVKNDDSVCCGNSTLQVFADDAKLYSSVNFSHIFVPLQQSCDSLIQWVQDWQLPVNINKSPTLSIAAMPQYPPRQYYINGVALPQQNSNLDVGVTISSYLSFQAHINNIVTTER
jgi:hypothetical protein